MVGWCCRYRCCLLYWVVCEASQVAAEAERGASLSVEETDKIVEVAGSKGAVYKVNLTKNTCTCSAFKFGKKGTCKHLEELKGAK